MKKILAKLIESFIIEALIAYAKREQVTGGTSQTHWEKWTTIITFLTEIKQKGLPL